MIKISHPSDYNKDTDSIQHNENIKSQEHIVTDTSKEYIISKGINSQNKSLNEISIPDHLTDIGITLHEKYNIDVNQDKMFSYIINNPNICTNNRHLHHVILVVSTPDHFNERQVMRHTWAQNGILPTYPSKTVYLIGKTTDPRIQDKLYKENVVYGDIIQADFGDSYHNITLKVLMGMKWVMEYCNNTKYVVRVNEDIFIDRITFVQIFENEYQHVTRCLMGLKMTNVSVSRSGFNCKHSACVGYEDHEGLAKYPLYLSGEIFILTPDILEELYQMALTINYFWIEDIFLTGFVREVMKDVNVIFLDSYMDLGDMRTFVGQFTTNKPTIIPKGPYFATLTDSLITSCIWALRLLHMNNKTMIFIGDGQNNHKKLWTKLSEIMYFMPPYSGPFPVQSRHSQAFMFSIGRVCSFMFYLPHNERVAYNVLIKDNMVNILS